MLKRAQQNALFLLLDSQEDKFKKFVHSCNELDSETVISSRDSREGFVGCTLLHEACRFGNLDAVVFLIGLGHIVDCIDTSVSGVTPLMEAISANNVDIVEFLIKNGASLSFQDFRGENAFHYAARIGTIMCLVLLQSQDVSSADIRNTLMSKNVKLRLPESLAINSFVADMLRQYRETGIFERPPRARNNKNNNNKVSTLP